MNPLEHADAMGRMDDIVPGGQLGKAVNLLGVFLPFSGPFGRRREVAVGDQRKIGRWVLEPGRKAAGQHRHPAQGKGFGVIPVLTGDA